VLYTVIRPSAALNRSGGPLQWPVIGAHARESIAEARGGIAKVAKTAGIERESLYRALSLRGNPRLSTLFAVTKAMGLTLTVETSHSANG
jgi:DNA-binding phage protein